MTQIEDMHKAVISGIKRLQKLYYKSPKIFLTEADVQCRLYSELIMQPEFKPTKVNRVDNKSNEKTKKGQDLRVTTPLHAELYRKGKKKSYVDLVIVPPKLFKFNKYDSPDYKEEKESIGIELKFNKWHERLCKKSNENKETKKWKNFEKALEKDLQRLGGYKSGILLFVDPKSNFKNQTAWGKFVKDSIPKSKKRTINAYYLSPKQRKIFEV
ncbi:MAG: hypothetical protein WC852_01560 [Candidatus Nanoarchaeia archaeon]|jgi:hypothetical protein